MKKLDEVYGKCVVLDDKRVREVVAPGMGMSLVRFSVECEQLLYLNREQASLAYSKELGPIILPFFGKCSTFSKLDYD